MNDYQITKLKKELQRKNQLVKEEREDREFTEKQLVQVQAERDSYHNQLVIARQAAENVDQFIAGKVKDMKLNVERENADSFSELSHIKDRLTQQLRLNEKLTDENRNKDTVIAELTQRLRQISKKHHDFSLMVNTKEMNEQAMITHHNFSKQTEQYNKVCQQLDNLLAENKILRKLQGVPDNFGFDLEEIKIAEKQELEDYKAQCRKLEAEIEELEGERTQLRYRLRQYNTLYSNKADRYKDMTQQQMELLDNYALQLKEGKVDIPQIDKSKKEMEKEIVKLRGQVEVLQSKNPISALPRGEPAKMDKESLKKLQDHIKTILQPFVADIKKLSENNINSLIQNFESVKNIQNFNMSEAKPSGLNLVPGNFNPPIPLPLAHNDWSKIKEGYSYTYSSKIPIEMKDFDDDVSFDVVKARYMVAALQLQNIESLKLLKEKQNYEDILAKQTDDLKHKYQRCLKVQDQLFIRYFKDKIENKEKLKEFEIKNSRLQDQIAQLEVKYNTLSEVYGCLSTKTELETKMKDYGARLAISESEVVKLERKCRIIKQDMKNLQAAYTNLESKSLEAEHSMKQKLSQAKKNQKELAIYTNKILDNYKNSVASDVHNAVLNRMQAVSDKYANYAFKETELRARIDQLESIEREVSIKDDVIESLRTDSTDLMLELEIVRSRLQLIDPDYNQYQNTFRQLIEFVNTNDIPLLTFFKKFDRTKDEKLNKDQFMTALTTLGFKISKTELDLMFSEFDLEGDGQIQYREFIRKLRRGGALSRSKEENAVYKLFTAIKHQNITIRKAFQIIDMDGSNSISKAEMQTAFRTIGIDSSSQTIDYLFKMCDADMDAKISCTELQKLYNDVIKDSAIDQKELYSESIDWKLAFVLKIQESSVKHHFTLQETFKTLDEDGNSCLSINELRDFLTKCGISIEGRHLLELFDFLDRRKDGKIEYGEFLKVLEEAKREQTRIKRIKFIKQRTEELRRENQVNFDQGEERGRIGEEAALRIRLSAMDTKIKTLLKKKEKLINTVVLRQEEIGDLKRTLEESQKSSEKLRDEYYKEKEAKVVLQERMKNSVTGMEAQILKKQVNELTVKETSSSTDLQHFKNLYNALSDKNRGKEMLLGKIESERNTYYDLVKNLQAETDLKAQLGEEKIKNQYSKRNEELINKKYDKVIEEIRSLTQDNNNLSQETIDKEKQIINTHFLMQEKSKVQQRTIDDLTSKILPTITLSKIQEIQLRMRNISNSKSELQKQNKFLREKNFNLQVRNDYIENEKLHMEELERRLRRNYPDDASTQIIDLSKKLSTYKMGELKAKRECGLLKEKEEYYMRVNNTNNDIIKDLEEELSQWEVKHNQRQDFWRNSINDQLKLMEEIKNEAEKSKKDNIKAQQFFKNQKQQDDQRNKNVDLLSLKRRQVLQSVVKGQADSGQSYGQSQALRAQINDLQQELLSKEKQIYQLRTTMKEIVPEAKFTDFGNQMGVSNNSFVMQTDLTTSQLKNNAKRFISSQKNQEVIFKEEAARLTQAAQHSIDTLQRIIDDKNEQLKRKDKMIENLKEQLMKNKEEDVYEIQKLNEEIRVHRSKTQMSSINELMAKSTHKNFFIAKDPQEKIDTLSKIVDQKDVEIRNMQTKYDTLFINKNSKVAKGNTSLELKVQDLQKERDIEKKRFQEREQKLEEKILNLEKLSKNKDFKLSQLQNTLKELKNQIVNEHKEMSEVEEGMGTFVSSMNRGHSANESKLQAALTKAMQTVTELTKKNRSNEAEMQKLREQVKMGRTARR